MRGEEFEKYLFYTYLYEPLQKLDNKLRQKILTCLKRIYEEDSAYMRSISFLLAEFARRRYERLLHKTVEILKSSHSPPEKYHIIRRLYKIVMYRGEDITLEYITRPTLRKYLERGRYVLRKEEGGIDLDEKLLEKMRDITYELEKNIFKREPESELVISLKKDLMKERGTMAEIISRDKITLDEDLIRKLLKEPRGHMELFHILCHERVHTFIRPRKPLPALRIIEEAIADLITETFLFNRYKKEMVEEYILSRLSLLARYLPSLAEKKFIEQSEKPSLFSRGSAYVRGTLAALALSDKSPEERLEILRNIVNLFESEKLKETAEIIDKYAKEGFKHLKKKPRLATYILIFLALFSSFFIVQLFNFKLSGLFLEKTGSSNIFLIPFILLILFFLFLLVKK